MDRAALDHVKTKLGATNSLERQLEGFALELRPDAMFQDGDSYTVVEMKAGRASLDAVERLSFYRDYYAAAWNVPRGNFRLVLAAKSVPALVREALHVVDGEILELPANLPLRSALPDGRDRSASGANQITTPKAWRIAYHLLTGEAFSIRQVALRAKVSYGWAHATVKRLEALRIARQDDGLYHISDLPKLLNGIAWERPFHTRHIATIPTSYLTAAEGARELTDVMSKNAIDFAFTGATAAGLYTGHGFRQDQLELYIHDPEVLPELAGPGGGPRLMVYRPDRPLADTEEKSGVRLASRQQVLLDLAGMGPAAKDLTQVMVDLIAHS